MSRGQFLHALEFFYATLCLPRFRRFVAKAAHKTLNFFYPPLLFIERGLLLA